MASLFCPNCGKDNPDFLDDCQFCQTPLRREALNIGEGPTKKTTGELEGVLPDWLREARQQARDASDIEDEKLSTQPKLDKASTPDLLAGLAFQAESEEEEVPDWLASLNPVAEKKSSKQVPAPAESEPPDFFAQFNQPQSEASSAVVPAETEAQGESGFRFEEAPAQPDTDWLSGLGAPAGQPAAGSEDLGWLKDLEASTSPAAEPTPSAGGDWMSNLGGSAQEDLSWLNNLGSTPAPSQLEQPAQEDLSWLNNLGGTPSVEEPAATSSADLDWLNNLGGVPAPETTSPAQPTQEDLSWLNNLGGTSVNEEPVAAPSAELDWLNNLGSVPAPETTPPAQPAQEDLGWLNNLGGTPVNEEPIATPSADLDWLNNLGSVPAPETTSPAQPAQEDLSWLNNLGGTPVNEEPAAAQSAELDWLNNLSGMPVPETTTPAPSAPTEGGNVPDWLKSEAESAEVAGPFLPTATGSLQKEAAANTMPDWLKSAADEAAAMLPLNAAASMDWVKSQEKPAEEETFSFGTPASISPEPASPQPAISTEQLDSLFNVDMPDWLTQDTSASPDVSSRTNVPAASADALAPVDLPSWVQAMRPVDAAISNEVSAVTTDQNTEREGPLAGLRGVIPASPIGSSQRPKALTLKLQATEEQQTGAALMEQIIAGESLAQAIKSTPEVASQRVLRWVLSALFLLVTGTFLGLGLKAMPVTVSPAEAAKITNISNVLVSLPQGAPVLVVMDYEPALAGEMEAVAGPLLDQAINLRRPTLTFIASSANGSALVDRLLKNTGAGQAYQPGSDYFNAGYLPGGSTGVQTFIMQPAGARGTVRANRFADFAAVIVITDQAESGLVWVEQLTLAKQSDPSLAAQPLLVAASAQAGPMLQPYVTSGQVTGMVAGIAQSAGYEHLANTDRPGLARTYWDAFGAGLMLAVLAIVLGSLWNVFMKLRANIGEQG